MEVSGLLDASRKGDKKALDRLASLVYGELRHLAHRYMAREPTGHSLQTTDLIHEAYLKMVDLSRIEWRDRAQFIAIAATFMRRILVDRARARARLKRGNNALRISLDEALLVPTKPEVDMVRLDEALKTLADFDPRKARVVELRFFGGLTERETAEVLKVSRETVKRDWKMAKLWLLAEMTDGARRHEAKTLA
jgi:RNA polymerase sigma factor (TIGR02999 family)